MPFLCRTFASCIVHSFYKLCFEYGTLSVPSFPKQVMFFFTKILTPLPRDQMTNRSLVLPLTESYQSEIIGAEPCWKILLPWAHHQNNIFKLNAFISQRFQIHCSMLASHENRFANLCTYLCLVGRKLPSGKNPSFPPPQKSARN